MAVNQEHDAMVLELLTDVAGECAKEWARA
jgi:hypothetical protein